MFPPGLRDALRPYLWLALAACLAGVASYALLGGPHARIKAPVAYVRAELTPAADAWNLPKRI